MLADLFLSQGVPMILGGDEIGRTQKGNNNAYCQDNEMSWYDWERMDWDTGRVRPQAGSASATRPSRCCGGPNYPSGEPDANGVPDVGWFTPGGQMMTEAIGKPFGPDARRLLERHRDSTTSRST